MSLLTKICDSFTAQCDSHIQSARSIVLGGGVTAGVHYLAHRVVWYFQYKSLGRSLAMTRVYQTVLGSTMLALPTWHLVDKHLTHRLPEIIKPIRYDLASLVVTGAVAGAIRPQMTLNLAGIIAATHLFWRCVGMTEFGKKALGLSS